MQLKPQAHARVPQQAVAKQEMSRLQCLSTRSADTYAQMQMQAAAGMSP